MLHLFSSVCDFPSSVHPRFLSSKLPERFPEPLIPVTRGAIQTEIKHPGLCIAFIIMFYFLIFAFL
jgi:hypothetical protein